jgi:hypothetical protein
MHLMFENCLAFNKLASYHNKYAATFRTWWLPEIEKLMLEELGTVKRPYWTVHHVGWC